MYRVCRSSMVIIHGSDSFVLNTFCEKDVDKLSNRTTILIILFVFIYNAYCVSNKKNLIITVGL